MFFAVSYDLSGSKKDHTEFFKKIKSFGGWMHYIDSTWIISTNKHSTAGEVFKELEPLIDQEEDYVLVIQVTPSNRQGWLPEKAWAWFKRNMA